MTTFLFTSESVSDGHPDKVCDQISDAIVDLFLKRDAFARCAIETAVTTNRVIVIGEYRSVAEVTSDEIDATVRRVVRDIGYEQGSFHHETLEIENYLHGQSADIAQGVDESQKKEEGAGDQGIMFGYASDETDAFMPAPLHYAHDILKQLKILREGTYKNMLLPDAKSQVTLRYEDERPIGVETVVVSTQHHESFSANNIRDLVIPVLEKIFPKGWLCPFENIYINPTGRFVIGGPDGDSGLTGRKIIVDTYGGASPHGGGAFSGKDPTKVDRSGAYMARYIAKNIVASGIARRCTIQISYSIGVSKPLSLYVNTHGTSQVCEQDIVNRIQEIYDLSPKGVRTFLRLNQAIYERTASFGHFGRDVHESGSFSWESVKDAHKFQDLKPKNLLSRFHYKTLLRGRLS